MQTDEHLSSGSHSKCQIKQFKILFCVPNSAGDILMLKKKITFLFEIQTELDFLYLPSNPRLQAIFFFLWKENIWLEGHCGPSQIKELNCGSFLSHSDSSGIRPSWRFCACWPEMCALLQCSREPDQAKRTWTMTQDSRAKLPMWTQCFIIIWIGDTEWCKLKDIR